MPACLAGQPLPAGADPYADHAWRQRLPVNPESRQFPVGVLLSSLSEIVAWSLILNFVLSVGEDKHSDALYYAIIALIELLQSKSFADTALMRLSSLMKNANSNTRVLILREVSKTEHIKTDIGQHILQKGRTDNHYFVKNLANVITKSIQEP